MYVTKDKKLAINTDLVQSVRVGSDDSVTIAAGNNAYTLSGDDAETLAKSFGLTTHADDAAAKKDQSAPEREQNHPVHQPVKK